MAPFEYCLSIDLSYWWMFFVAVAIATLGNATGLGGGPFFSSVFLLVLHLPPQVAVGTAMLTKAFGLSSGSYAHWRNGLVDFAIAAKLLVVAVPLAVLGSYLTGMMDPSLLLGLIALAILFISYRIYRSPKEEELKGRPGHEAAVYSRKSRRLTNSYDYLINNIEGWGISGIGAFLDGFTSAALGEFNDYLLIVRSRVPAKVAVGTSIFVLAVVSISSAIVHVGSARPLLSIAMFTVPGVLLGAQIGARFASRLNPNLLKRIISLALVFVSLLLLLKALAGIGVKI